MPCKWINPQCHHHHRDNEESSFGFTQSFDTNLHFSPQQVQEFNQFRQYLQYQLQEQPFPSQQHYQQPQQFSPYIPTFGLDQIPIGDNEGEPNRDVSPLHHLMGGWYPQYRDEHILNTRRTELCYEVQREYNSMHLPNESHEYNPISATPYAEVDQLARDMSQVRIAEVEWRKAYVEAERKRREQRHGDPGAGPSHQG